MWYIAAHRRGGGGRGLVLIGGASSEMSAPKYVIKLEVLMENDIIRKGNY